MPSRQSISPNRNTTCGSLHVSPSSKRHWPRWDERKRESKKKRRRRRRKLASTSAPSGMEAMTL
eukprot:3935118-Rhodomonas_salina.1